MTIRIETLEREGIYRRMFAEGRRTWWLWFGLNERAEQRGSERCAAENDEIANRFRINCRNQVVSFASHFLDANRVCGGEGGRKIPFIATCAEIIIFEQNSGKARPWILCRCVCVFMCLNFV